MDLWIWDEWVIGLDWIKLVGGCLIRCRSVN